MAETIQSAVPCKLPNPLYKKKFTVSSGITSDRRVQVACQK